MNPIVDCLIYCLLIVKIKCFPIINYENLDQLTYSVEPKFLFNFEFNIPLVSFLDKPKIATINLPMTITIKETPTNDQQSTFEESTINKEPNQPTIQTVNPSKSTINNQINKGKSKLSSNYPAYIPIYYDDQDDYQGDNLQENQQQSTKLINNSTLNNQRNDYNHRRNKFSFQQRIKRNQQDNLVEGVNCFSKLVCQISRSQLIGYHLLEPIVINISRLTESIVNQSETKQFIKLLGPLREAEQFGRLSGNCEEKYSNCN